MKTIGSAPTDGTHILLYGIHESDVGEHGQEPGWCEGFCNEGTWVNLIGYDSHPTHWMYLPDFVVKGS